VRLEFRLVTHEVGLGSRGEALGGSHRDAVCDLFARYGRAVDERDRDALGEVFAREGTFVNEFADGEVASFSSRAAIVEFVAGATSDPARQLRHLIGNVQVEGSRVRANLVLFVTADGATSPATTGVYDGETVAEDGRLRFARLDCRLDAAL